MRMKQEKDKCDFTGPKSLIEKVENENREAIDNVGQLPFIGDNKSRKKRENKGGK